MAAIVSVLLTANLGVPTTAAGTQTCTECPMYGGFLTCDPQSCDWRLLNGYWAGNVSDGSSDLLVALCPLGLCLYNQSDQFIYIPRSAIQSLNEFLCNGTHRMGTLCGLCQPGYAPAINNGGYASGCVPCDGRSSKVNWFFYILAIYVPLLALFLAIIVFNIRLTTGPLNSFILFAQLVSSTVDINQQGAAPLNLVYGKGTNAFENSYQIPYNFFNLNIFGDLLPPFCLHSGLETLDVIALRYAEAFFPVLVIIAIILLLQCQRYLKVPGIRLPSRCQCHRRKYRIGASLVHAFAAFVLLAYNRLCETTAYLLIPVPLFDQTLQTVERRVYLQGTYSSTDAKYAERYKLPAYLITILLVMVPIVLFHYPLKWVERLMSKVRCLRNVYPTASVAIVLDTFQGCYKDNRRYFAGLYFALRLLLFFAFFLPLLLDLLVQEILFIVYIFLLAILKPYNDKRLNYLDIAIFTNLALINILSWYTVNQIQPDAEPLAICIVFESILVFLPMLYFVGCVLFYITKCWHTDAKEITKVWYSKARQRVGRGAEESKNTCEVPALKQQPSQTVIDEDFYTITERASETTAK